MAHVVTRVPPPIAIGGGAARGAIEVLTVPAARDNLVWLIADRRRAKAYAVDGPDAEAVLAACAREGLALVGLLNTHTHGDHVGINHDLAARGLLAGMDVVGPAAVAARIPGLRRPVAGGDALTILEDVAVTVITTEGHHDGHVSFVVSEALFCGDALFTGGCGRMFTGPATAFWAGLERLRQLPDATLVFCAHEYTEDNLRFARSVEPHNVALSRRSAEVSELRAAGLPTVPGTIGLEKATNPFLRWDSAELVATLARELPDVPLDTPVDVFAAARRLKDLGRYRAA